MKPWHPLCWQQHPVDFQPSYADLEQLQAVLAKLAAAPPLVSPEAIESCKQQLASAYRGECFILQAGDCAESFAASPAYATKMAEWINELATILAQRIQQPVVSIGRIAGQFAKPRTFTSETRANQTLPSYQGDLVNDVSFSASARRPQPQRLWQGYQLAQAMIEQLATCKLKQPFFTSHEALHLAYESALTRRIDANWYNLGCHFPWIGMRSNCPSHGHAIYASGLANPIAVKLGPNHSARDVTNLVQQLDPRAEPGKLTLITRLGHHQVQQLLPRYIEAVKRSERDVLWFCDPMHANSCLSMDGLKTRRLCDIATELQATIDTLTKHDLSLRGLHLELTWQQVTECLDSPTSAAQAIDLRENYRSLMDPRLNPSQALSLIERSMMSQQPDNLASQHKTSKDR